jgi:hypothetical protein
MQMEVINQGLAPGVQHSDKSQLAIQTPFGIGGEKLQGLVDGLENQIQTKSAIVEHQRVEQMRQGEDQVEVAAGQYKIKTMAGRPPDNGYRALLKAGSHSLCVPVFGV